MLGVILMLIGGVCGLAALVCSILVAVKMFQNGQTGLGVAAIVGMFICGFGYIITLIYGWKNKDIWSLQKVMPIYTACFVAALIFYGAGYALVIPELLKAQQQGGL